MGSIEVHSGFGGIPHSAVEIHQIYQRSAEKKYPGYISEKAFTHTFIEKPYEFVISGRADGFLESRTPLIEEIKTAFDVDSLKDKLINNSNHPYFWQLRTYGYFYFKETNIIPDLKLQLISSRNFKTLSIEVDLNLEDYETWLLKRLNELVKETKAKEKIFNKRIENAPHLAFPFPSPRPGQLELVETISSNFLENTPLLIEAPTGLGKTAGVLYPALKESLYRGQKVVFVTPKNSQHQLAEKAVNLMQDQGAKIKCVTITSKSKMCLKEEVLCNPEYCEFARDYYKKLSDHDLVNKVGKLQKLTSRKFKELGEKYEVCPFELSLEAIDRSEVVIGDYNYVFSPRSLIGRLTEPFYKAKEKPNLVIDEAHNLPSRAQDYFSPGISLLDIKKIESAIAQLNISDSFLDEAIALTRELIFLIQTYSGASRKITIDANPFTALSEKVRDLTSRYLEMDITIHSHDPILGLSNLVNNFDEALELTGEEFFQTYQKTYNDELLKITCCDASNELKLAYKEFKNVVAFSATLKPFSYYQQLMGFSEKTKHFEFSSPFERENRKIMMIPQISTKYKDRSMSAPKICEVIERILNVKAGNYIALFPSFEFMKLVEAKLNLSESFQILTQQRDMKLSTIKDYLNQLREGVTPTLLLGVQGGVFSEGVDYPGEMLIGAFIVGPALPTFDFEREQIKVYYEKRYGTENAFNYTYVFPAMAKAIQSAGRVVRTETDRGIIVLIDPRFLEESYYQTMPKEWFNETPRELVSTKILQDIQSFWEKSV